MSQELVDAIADMRDEDAVRIAGELIEGGTSPLEVLDDCKAAMAVVGERFEKEEYFVPELILAGDTLKRISEIARPHLDQEEEAGRAGKVLLATVQGDIHDIGKDIVRFMLEINGFEVHDLGIDVPIPTVVDAVRTEQPDVVALSGLLTLSYDAMRDTVSAIDSAGLRGGVKIMIGGGSVDEKVREFAGADAYGADAVAAVNLAKGWTEVKGA